MFQLDNRLMLCASFVPEGARLADIGTDHAYLPVWLLKNNLISYAYACDINPAPLKSGQATAEKYQAENIEFHLSNGLKALLPQDNINAIVIAGMGGELIAEILNESPLVKNKNLTLILQPMTKAHKLIEFLYNNGFVITKQKTCESHKKHYTVMAVKFTGKKQEIEPSFAYTGILDLQAIENYEYIIQQINGLENQGKGDSRFTEIAEKIKEKLK